MAQHLNFYETTKEASIRLSGTVVLYDGHPYYVLCISDHKADGVFRIYLDDIAQQKGAAHQRIPMDWSNYPQGHSEQGVVMDKWLEKYPNEGVIRKMMNSPSFNKFRPFPLGMVNVKGSVVYTERSPTRSTFQGLSQQMVTQTPVTIIPKEAQTGRLGRQVSYIGREIADTILGRYPSVAECLAGLSDPRVGNEAVAFHRNFALVRGPLDMMFLAYKGDVIGVLPNHDLSVVTLGSGFGYCKEAVAELSIFGDIKHRK